MAYDLFQNIAWLYSVFVFSYTGILENLSVSFQYRVLVITPNLTNIAQNATYICVKKRQ